MVMARRKQAGRNRNGVGSVREVRPGLWEGTIQLAPNDRRYVSTHERHGHQSHARNGLGSKDPAT